MQKPHPLIVLLVSAFAIVDLCLWVAIPMHLNWGTLLLASDVMVFAQLGLVAIWLLIGRARFSIRILTSIALYVGLYFLAARSGTHNQFLVALFTNTQTVVGLPLLIMRVCDFRLQNHNAIEAQIKPSAFQFSLFNVLELVTVAAALAAIGPQVAHVPLISGEVLLTTFIFCSVVPMLVWGLLAKTKPILKSSLAAISVIALAVAIANLMPRSGFQRAMACVAIYSLIAVALFVVRTAGYRFSRCRLPSGT